MSSGKSEKHLPEMPHYLNQLKRINTAVFSPLSTTDSEWKDEISMWSDSLCPYLKYMHHRELAN